MEQICVKEDCTGCGMCANICPQQAICMTEDEYGFVYPIINNTCVECGICSKRCPANNSLESSVIKQEVFAAWTKNKSERKKSTSGGVFSEIARYVISKKGIVVGVSWTDSFTPQHVLIDNISNLDKLKGSKYAQSDTNDIYRKVQLLLNKGKYVLFSGTPCQIAALKLYLNLDYENLITIDLVCHGVPSANMLCQHYKEVHDASVKEVQLRYKDPYWDYSYVKIDYLDGYKYQKLTIEDDYFNLFNIGYSLRKSCHDCKYATTKRVSDITLADFWGYAPERYRAISYNNGTSCVILNSKKGMRLFEQIKDNLYYEPSTMEEVIKGNQCLKEPFKIDEENLSRYWSDYINGNSIHELNHKYAANTFRVPKLLKLRRMYKKYKWMIKR